METVEADHFSMVAPPDVYQLGEVIIRLVKKAAAQSFVTQAGKRCLLGSS